MAPSAMEMDVPARAAFAAATTTTKAAAAVAVRRPAFTLPTADATATPPARPSVVRRSSTGAPGYMVAILGATGARTVAVV